MKISINDLKELFMHGNDFIKKNSTYKARSITDEEIESVRANLKDWFFDKNLFSNVDNLKKGKQ